jgi:hypothetical protein
MATRMQQRRGTASQWTSANPVLNAGEMGWESDTNKFKIGDGTNHWADLDYFADTNSTVNPSFGTSIIFEGATADSYETTLQVTDPTADRTITFPDATGTVALTTDIAELSQDAIDTALTAGTGITKTYNDNANTLTLAVDTTTIQARVADVSDTEIGYLNGVTSAIQTQLDDKSTASKTETLTNKSISLGSNTITSTLSQLNSAVSDADVASIAGAETLTNKTLTSPVINTPTGITKTDVGLANVDNTSDANKPVSTAGQTALDLKANLAGATFTGALSGTSLTLSGDLTINGTTTTINSTTLSVDDKNIILGDVETPTDTTADGGGITLKGLTDKTFNWVDATDSWTSSEHINLASGKSYSINGTALKDVSETLTNKTLTTPVISSISNTGTLTLPTSTDTLVGRATTDTLTNKTLTSPIITGLTLNDSSIVFEGSTADDYETTLTITDPTAGGGTGTSGQVLKSTGSGVEWTTPAGGAAFNEFMLIGA